MRDFIYDLRRTLTGKFTIVMIVLIVLATVGIAYASVSGNSSSTLINPSSTAYVLPAVYNNNGTYKVVDFAVNGYGEPVNGLHVVTWLSNSGSDFVSGSSKNATPIYINGSTNNNGYFNATVSSKSNYSAYYYSSEYISDVNTSLIYVPIYYSNNNLSSSIYSATYSNLRLSLSLVNHSFYYLLKVANESSKIKSNLLIYYNSDSGKPMSNEDIYYFVTNATGYGIPMPESQMTYLRTVGGFHSDIFSLPLNRTANNALIIVELFSTPKNETVAYAGTFYSSSSASSQIEGILQLPYEFLIPILGIFSAYFYYGKDKASGVLESIITRPVTKGRIMVSRFTGGALSFLAAIFIALALTDLLVLKYTDTALSASSFASILLGYTVEAIGFAGIVYFVSQFVKSQGGILGIGIGLFFVMVIFWSMLMDIILFEVHANLAVKSGVVDTIILNSLSPAYFPTLVLDYHTNSYGSILGVGSGILASSVGITLASVVIVGIIWVVVPALASFFLARSRD